MHRCRIALICALLFCLGGAAPVVAQVGVATIVVAVTLPDGTPAPGARVEVTPAVSGTGRSVAVDASNPVAALPLASGSYRVRVLLDDFRPWEQTLYLAAGTVRRLAVRLAPEAGMGRSTVATLARFDAAYHTSLAPEHLTDLPSSGTVWSLLETAHPFLISDRTDDGGLWIARPALLGGQGPGWNQTAFRLDGLDVTDPRDLGAPAIYPDLRVLDAVEVDAARLPAEVGGPGPVITLIPRRPGSAWSGNGELFFMPAGLQPDVVAGAIPAFARFDSFTDAGLTAGGPIAPHAGLFAAVRGTRAGRLERADPLVLPNNVGALYGHIVAVPNPNRELRFIGALSQATRPFAGRARFANRDQEERGKSVLAQATVEQIRGSQVLSLSAGYQHVSNDPQVDPGTAGGNVERLLDGYPLALADQADSASRRWTVAGTFAPSVRRWFDREHLVRMGATVGGASATNRAVAQPAFGELVNGVPARVWDVVARPGESRWTSTTAAAFVSDRISMASRVTLDAGVRLDVDRGSAAGAANTIGWADLSPRFSARWQPTDGGRMALTAGYSWYRHRLPLDYFSVGDPGAPTGTVYRWDDRNGDLRFTGSEMTPVAYVGTCCAGGQASLIDPDLRRPSVGEFYIGIEHTFGPWKGRIVGIDRRERNVVALVDTGVTAADYSVSYVTDPGIDIAGRSGFFQLPVYERRPASFGQDRYLLTNPAGPAQRHQSVEITAEKEFGRRWFFRFGGAAYRSEGVGMSRGFLSTENDQGVLGETFLNPNALTSSYGRLFYDRAFVIKLSGLYRAPGDVRIGMVARYQDGQPFSRLVIADALYQGRDFVQAIPRGAQRFTYVYTLDAKVEKDITLGGRSLGLVLEVFNLSDSTLEVEEDVVTGPAFRTITAVQPPRAVRVGVRIGF